MDTLAAAQEAYAFPASFHQERLWFLDQLEPGSTTYNLPAALGLRGKLDVSLLQRSLNAIVQRHEALRTTFRLLEGHLVQVIASCLHIPLPVVDLRNLSRGEREAQARRLASEEARHPFELTKEPLLRALVLHLGVDEHLLLLTTHHIVSDGWSQEVLYRELASLYRAFSAGLPSPLPELPIQYADFSVWQRKVLQGGVLASHLAYWKKQLQGAPPGLELPTDRSRLPIPTSRGAEYRLQLPKPLTRALKKLSREASVTLYITLVAAFQTLLYRYSGQDDVVIGSVAAGRTQAETEALIGFFVNTLVLRTDLSGDPTFRALLLRVREVVLEAQEHQELPFELLVKELQPERQMGKNPLFQIMLVLHPPPSALPSGWEPTSMEIETAGSKFDLTLELYDWADGLWSCFEYRTALFDEATVARIARHWQTLLEGIVADPERHVSELPLLTEVERRQLLVEWNGAAAGYLSEETVHQLFEAQAERTPEAVAVVSGNERLSYRELDRRANQLAHCLRGHGIGPDVPVGLFLERPIDMVVAMLGVLKAGGAYVTLDPEHPPTRLAFLLADTQTPLLVSRQSLRGRLPAYSGQIFCLDTDLPPANQETPPAPLAQAKHLAYVLYTSGSTGKPKGVLVTHENLSHSTTARAHVYDRPVKSFLLLSSFTFDSSAAGIFWTLGQGGTLVLTTRHVRMDVLQVAALIARWDVTHTLCTPSLYALLLTHPRPELLASLQVSIVAGEACAPALVERHFACLPDTALFNEYGPTECTVWSSVYRCRRGEENKRIPIGRPIVGTQIYLLDRHLQPVPVSVPGELYIAGPGVARGYLHLPDQTRERFLPNPFGPAGSRLYKTGDLACYLPDGNLEFLGRLDRQFKLRGYRIEAGEVESALSEHPAVSEAVVMVREAAGGEPQLVAYILPRQGCQWEGTELRAFLQSALPGYMVPASFVALPAWPLTPHGKVDYAAFPAPDRSGFAGQVPHVRPNTAMECLLADIWTKTLHLEGMGRHDNFFELGGHSLLAAQLVARMSMALSLAIPIKTLFDYPTIAGLAAALGNLPPSNAGRGQTMESPLPFHVPEASPRELEEHEQRRSATEPAQGLPYPLSPNTTLETRPLSTLITSGELPLLDAAALGYLVEDEYPKAEPAAVLRDLFGMQPVLTDVIETAWGRVGILILPLYTRNIYTDHDHLLRQTIEALRQAKLLGARAVSLTGLLPSALGYGQDVLKPLEGTMDLPTLTTGHATTASAVVLTINRMMVEAGRSLSEERVGFLGLGSIGLTTLRLLLTSCPHPRAVLLCDLYTKRPALERIRDEVVSQLGFGGTVGIVEARGSSLPAQLYEGATLIVGATNVPDVLDINRLAPGTIIVDDSGPHCFVPARARQRFETDGDILFTEGGALRLPGPTTQISSLPPMWLEASGEVEWQRLCARDPHTIMGCVFSSLLTAEFLAAQPTVGSVENAVSLSHYRQLASMGVDAAQPSCEGYTLPPERIHAFRLRYSRAPHNQKGE